MQTMQTSQSEKWVVYQASPSGTRFVCSENEWREIELNSGFSLIAKDLPSEAQAEQLARPAAETPKKTRRSRLRIHYPWLGAAPE